VTIDCLLLLSHLRPVRRHIVVLHAQQQLLPRHATSQLAEPVRLVESELPVVLFTDAVDRDNDEHLCVAAMRGTANDTERESAID
jgi:hypothetical protein